MTTATAMKRCTECGEEKSLDDFHRNHRMKDGHVNQCKECRNRRQRENPPKRDKRERADAQRRYAQRHPGRRNSKAKRQREREPEKILARAQLREAVESGFIIKPDACEECGRKAALEGHHTDYLKPFLVRWLCAPCHLAEHGKEAHHASA